MHLRTVVKIEEIIRNDPVTSNLNAHKNGTPVAWKDSTLSFQLVQTLVNLALAGNANEAAYNLKIEDNKGPDGSQ